MIRLQYNILILANQKENIFFSTNLDFFVRKSENEIPLQLITRFFENRNSKVRINLEYNFDLKRQ